MKKVIRLTEADIEKLVKKIISEEKRIVESYRLEDILSERKNKLTKKGNKHK